MTTSLRSLRLVVPAAALLALAAGCGGSEDSIASEFRDYCAVAKQEQAIFVDDGTGLGLVTNIGRLEKIADEAPEDLSDEWQVLLAAANGLRDAIASVGLEPGDFVDGQPPAATSAADRQTIAAAADRLSQADVVEAANGIEQHAKDICKLQLGL